MMNHLLTESLKVYRRVNVGSSFKPSWSWALTFDVRGLPNQLSASKIIRNEGNVIVADWQAYFAKLAILQNDRVVHGTNVFDVYSVADPNVMGRHTEVTMKIMPVNTLTEMGIGAGLDNQRLIQLVTVSSDASAGQNLTMLYAMDITMVMVDATANAVNGAVRLRTGTTAISDAVTCAVTGTITVSEAITASVKRTTVGKVLNIISTGDDATAPRGIVYIIGTPYGL